MNTYIDTHAHLWSEEYLDYLKKTGSKDTDVARNIGQSDSDEDLFSRFENMDRAGVKIQILSAVPQSPQWGSEEEAKKSAFIINDLYKTLVQKYPQRFRAYGAVSLPYVDLAKKQAKEILNDDHFIGIAIPTLIQNEVSIADDRFEEFFEFLDSFGANLYIHPTGCGGKSDLVNDYDLEWVIGAPLEVMIVTLELLKKEIPNKYKNINFHISHLGGALPFLMTRIKDNYEDWDSFNYDPEETLKNNFSFDTANFNRYALISSINTYGFDKLMLGSDFPYFKDDKYKRAVDYIKNSGIDDREIEAILKDNAISFYGIKDF